MDSVSEIRRKLDLTQAELGSMLGLNQSTISRFENGTLSVDERTALALEALQARRANLGSAAQVAPTAEQIAA